MVEGIYNTQSTVDLTNRELPFTAFPAYFPGPKAIFVFYSQSVVRDQGWEWGQFVLLLNPEMKSAFLHPIAADIGTLIDMTLGPAAWDAIS